MAKKRFRNGNQWNTFSHGVSRGLSNKTIQSMSPVMRSRILYNESIKIPVSKVLPLLQEKAYGGMPPYHDLTENIRGRDRILVNDDGLVVYSDFGFGEFARIFSPKTLTFGRQSFCVCCHARAAWFGKTAIQDDGFYTLDMFSDDNDLFTKDHIEPKMLGGRDVKYNLVTCCYSCNIMKGSIRKSWKQITDVLSSIDDPEKAISVLGIPKGNLGRVRKCMIRMRKNYAEESNNEQPFSTDNSE